MLQNLMQHLQGAGINAAAAAAPAAPQVCRSLLPGVRGSPLFVCYCSTIPACRVRLLLTLAAVHCLLL
jgi:hypothetical protein